VRDGILEIRRVEAADAESVASLLAQLGYPASVDEVERRLERLLASEADVQLVAVTDGEVVGLVGLQVGLALEYDEPVGKLSELVIEEGHRGRGVGRALVAAVEREARRRGCCLLYLTTAARRKDAHAFYERIGFEETGKRFVKTLA
jgi:GNAT superfamily N-acetyltransferase